MIKKYIKEYRSPIITILFYAFFIIYIQQTNEDFLQLLKLLPVSIVFLIIGLRIFKLFINSQINKKIFDNLNNEITYFDHFRINYFNTLLNSIGPVVVGGGYRLDSYVRKMKIKLLDYVSISLGFTFYSFISYIYILFSILFLKNYSNNFGSIFIVISLSFVFLLLVLFVRYCLKLQVFIKNENLYKISYGFSKLFENNKNLLSIFLLHISTVLVTSISIFLISYTFIEKATFLDSISFTVLTAVGSFVGLTPGGIGISEMLIHLSNLWITYPLETIFYISLLNRATSLLAILLLYFPIEKKFIDLN